MQGESEEEVPRTGHPNQASISKLLPGHVTKKQEEASGYLEERRIPGFLNFLMQHLVVTRPDEPLDYLYHLLDKCLLFRAGLVEPPLLFGPRHIENVFKRFDPEGLGYISLNQYAIAMKTLGIYNFNKDPMECRCNPNKVDKKTFETEAKRYLTEALKEMIGNP